MFTVTENELATLAPRGDASILRAVAAVIGPIVAAYEINTRLRWCHFIAQAAHETDGFKTLEEYGGASYFEKHYGPQTAVGKRLGNTEPGDGARFHGRGPFQLTGRYNYNTFGKLIGEDLVSRPERAALADVGCKVAGVYWKSRKINALADADDINGVTKKINGGLNGLRQRTAYLNAAKEIWPHELSFEPAKPKPKAKPLPPVPEDGPAIATEPPKSLAKSKTIWGTITSMIGGTGAGYSLSSLFDNPQAVWIVAILAGFVLIAGLALALVFRERLAKMIEHGI